MTVEMLKDIREAVDFWKNEDSTTLLAMLVDYARNEGYYTASNNEAFRTYNAVNAMAIRKILCERLEA